MGRGPRYYESRLNRRDSVDKSAENEEKSARVRSGNHLPA